MPPQEQPPQPNSSMDIVQSPQVEPTAQPQAPVQKPNKSKLIILIILVLAMVAGAASFFIFNTDETTDSANSTAPVSTESDTAQNSVTLDAKELNTEFLNRYSGSLELSLVEGELNSSTPQAIFSDAEQKYFISQDLDSVSQLTYPIDDLNDTDLLGQYDGFLTSKGLSLEAGSMDTLNDYYYAYTIARYTHGAKDCFITYWRVESQARNLTIGCAERPTQAMFNEQMPFYEAYSVYYDLELGFTPDGFGNEYAIMVYVDSPAIGATEGYEIASGGSTPVINQNGVYSTDVGGGRAAFYRKTGGDWQYFEGASGQDLSSCGLGYDGQPFTEDALFAFADFPCYNESLGDANYTFGKYLEENKQQD